MFRPEIYEIISSNKQLFHELFESNYDYKIHNKIHNTIRDDYQYEDSNGLLRSCPSVELSAFLSSYDFTLLGFCEEKSYALQMYYREDLETTLEGYDDTRV